MRLTPPRYLLITALAGVPLVCALGYQIWSGAEQRREIRSLEATIGDLKAELNEVRSRQPEARTSMTRGASRPVSVVSDKTGSRAAEADNVTGSIQILKDLETVSETDPRSYQEKLQELLSGNPSAEKIAIASRFIFDKAGDQQGLPDYALQSLYASQPNADLRRVIAQVLSQRGNNALLNNQIAEAQAKLMSSHPADRQEALGQLAKTHSTKAVDAIAPFLEDPDRTVRLEALFALRDTGNQQHVNLVEGMIHDPDPSVSLLASDVLSSLKNLSSSARTQYSRSEIEAELPPIANP